MALSHAILATLLERPCSGYDLMKQFEGSVGFFWRATHQQIYRELSKMEAQGWLATETIQQEGRPNKKVYSIAEAGKQHLQEWIAQPGEVSSSRDEILVKLFAGFLVPPQTMLAQLNHHLVEHRARLTTYRQIEQQHFLEPEKLSQEEGFRYQTLKFGIRYETEWIAWCEDVISGIGKVKDS